MFTIVIYIISCTVSEMAADLQFPSELFLVQVWMLRAEADTQH